MEKIKLKDFHLALSLVPMCFVTDLCSYCSNGKTFYIYTLRTGSTIKTVRITNDFPLLKTTMNSEYFYLQGYCPSNSNKAAEVINCFIS